MNAKVSVFIDDFRKNTLRIPLKSLDQEVWIGLCHIIVPEIIEFTSSGHAPAPVQGFLIVAIIA